MSLTVNTGPEYIDRVATFNVTTSLVEDSTHVNLRVRADIYHEGVIKAVVEKPKGLADFDFGDILKSLTPGLKFARDSGAYVNTGSVGSEECTAIVTESGAWDHFTIAGNQVVAADIAAATAAYARLATISMTIGELYLVKSVDYATTGVNLPYLYLASGGSHYRYFEQNKGFLLMPTATASTKILIGNAAGEINFTGTFNIYKITTNRTTTGNALAPYFVTFTEVYEIADGTTTTGGTYTTILYRFVPAYGDGTAFTEYVMHDSVCLFANKTLVNNVTKFFSNIPYEYWLCFFTESMYCYLDYYKDGGGSTKSYFNCYEGWGVVIINIGELMASVTSYIEVQMVDSGGSPHNISAKVTIYKDTSQIDERVILEYDGLTGGKEYLAFEGLKNISFGSLRNYYQATKKNRKLINATGINRQKLETRYKDISNADYLKSLIISDNVKKLEASYATPTDVTVLTEDVKISDTNMFTNQIDIEYEY